MAPNNFDKNIKDKFNTRKIEPSSQAWDRLDAMLTVAEEKKQPKNYFWLKIAASFLLFSGIGYLFFQQNQISEISQPTNEIVVATEKQNLNNNDVENENTIKPVENLAENSTKKGNSASEKVIKQNDNSKQKSKLNSYLGVIEKQNEGITQKENQNQEQTNQKPPYNYVTPENLLAEVQGNKKVNGNTNTYKSTLKVNPNELLNSVESELDQSFKNKTLAKFKQAKSAFVNRNYN